MVNLQIIKQIANEKKITIRKLAKDVGITEQGLQTIIRKNTTTTDNLFKIANILSVPVSIFFDQTENIVSEKVLIPDKENNSDVIVSLVKQNGELVKQVSDMINMQSNLITMQKINADTINNLSSKVQEGGDSTLKNVSGGL